MTISKTGGLIAAASKKLSQPTLELGGITIVKRIVLTFQQMGLFPIVVVTGVEADEVRYQLAGRGVVFLFNEEFEDPELFDSVKLGLSFLQGKCERVVFSPVNVPLFFPSTLQTLLNTTHEITVPMYKDESGHPVLFTDAVISNILGWSGTDGLRGALGSMPEFKTTVDVDDKGVLLSIHQQDLLQMHYEKNKSAFLHPHLRLSLEREDEVFNPRIKTLLLLIGETKSVRKAGNMMALSPSKAWEMLNKLESTLGYAIILRSRGGVQGSRSELTKAGYDFLKAWQHYEEVTAEQSNRAFTAVRNIIQNT